MKFDFKSGLPSGVPVYEYDELASTNDRAKEVALGEKGAFVIAAKQSAGKGRLGRSFSSEQGGLYCSYAFEPKCGLQDMFLLMPLTAVVASRLIEKTCGVSCGIKWPNDVTVDGKKVCGIMTEAIYKDGKYRMIVGIGINFENELPSELTEAASLIDKGETFDLSAAYGMLFCLMTELVEHFPENAGQLLSEYRKRCVTLGKKVTVTYNGEKVNGIAAAIGDRGGLVVDTIDGKRIEITSGEATLRL